MPDESIAAPICIDSDDEVPSFQSIRHTGKDHPRFECIACNLTVQIQGGTRIVGVIGLRLRCSILEIEPLVVPRPLHGHARLPTSSVQFIDVQKDGRSILIKVRRPQIVGDLISSLFQHWCASVGAKELMTLKEFGLSPREDEMRDIVSTLQVWFPHVAMQGLVNLSLKAQDSILLRLDGIGVTGNDVQLLGDECWLNDTLLDFFLRLVMEVVAPQRLKSDLYVVSTFFFQKLTSGGAATGEEGWNNVARWTRSLSDGILNQRFVVVPINEQNLHWWLAVVAHPSRALMAPDDNDPSATLGEAPRIVCLDSAVEPVPKNTAMDFLQGYIRREYSERYEPTGEDNGQNAICRIKAVSADVPKQENGYDCGIFVIEYLLHLLQSRSALAGLGLAPHRHWFGQAAVSHRRKRLRWIIAKLQSEARRRSECDVGILLSDKKLRTAIASAFTDPASQKRKAEFS